MVAGPAVLVALLLAGMALSAPAALAAPANDNYASRQVLNGALPIQIVGTTEGATEEPGEEEDWFDTWQAGHSVWFEWTPPATQWVSIGACDSEIPALVGIFVGPSMGSLYREIDGYASEGPHCKSRQGQFSFKAIEGTMYKIAVDGNDFFTPPEAPPDTEGPFTLRIETLAPPVNDDFDQALPLIYDSVYTGSPSEPFHRSERSGYNWAATKEPGEPNHEGDPGGASVWYTWTAPATGDASFNACCFTVEQIGIYAGDRVDALTPVQGSTNQYSVPVTQGVTYRIAVDGYFVSPEIGARTGSFSVSASIDLPPVIQPPLVIDSAPADLTPPNTTLFCKKVKPRKRKATFSFRSSDPDSRFRCKIDGRPFKACASAKTYVGLAQGPHKFAVVAVDAAGNPDPTPATARFGIVRAKPKKAPRR